MAINSYDKLDQKEVAGAVVAARQSGLATSLAATTSQIGDVLKATTVANVAAATGGTDTVTQTNLNLQITAFNTLLTNLRAAGMIV